MALLPILETKRLTLRPISREDAVDLFDYTSHPTVGPSAGWKPHTSIEETYSFIDYCIKKREFGQPGTYVIFHKQDQLAIGTIEVHTYKQHKGEIGFVLHPDYWNKGYMTEAAKMLIIYAFEILQLERLTYCHFIFNKRSKRVCEKLEFTFEGVLRKKFKLYTGEAIDEAIYSIIDDEYFQNKLSWLKSFKKELERL